MHEHEDAMTDRAGSAIPPTPTSTPPGHLRNQGRRIKPLTHRRQRGHSAQRSRSRTPTPTPAHGSPEQRIDAITYDSHCPFMKGGKRKRGRPPGSKNEKALMPEPEGSATASGGADIAEPPSKKRGRPPKDPRPDLEDLERPSSKRRKV
ncbi:hypothetical protein C8T65DRAFT_741762 [Cerioporus squamosus]|nr:hypothetical protein C8T65DRAFT_741762 [Cerioporus squamosus]